MIPRSDIRRAVNQAVRQAYEDLALLAVRPCDPAQARERAQGQVFWSWISIDAPFTGTLALVQPVDLAKEMAATVLANQDGEARLTEVIDAQCELTNIIAGRALTQLIGKDQVLKLGVPASGTGAPDVRQGEWLGQTFATGRRWLAVFLHSPDLLGVEIDDPVVASSKLAEPETSSLRPSEASGDADRMSHSAALEAKPGAAPGSQRRPSSSARHVVPPVPAVQLPPTPPVAVPRPSPPMPMPMPVPMPPPAARAPGQSDRQPVVPAAVPGQGQRPSSISGRRGVVRTIHGLVSASGAPGVGAVGDAPPPAGDPEHTLPWHRVPTAKIAAFAIPETLGHYRVLGRLGEGGMGVVLKAQHQTLDRLVALKVMKPSLAKDQAYVQRFMSEARLAASLEHPNLVTVYDAAQEGGLLYMALRYVDGGDLDGLLHREGPLAQARALAIFTGCAHALEAISAKGLVHRDIKPANILLEPDGTPRLADFGLARESAAGAGDPAAAGTPSYMSPEQLERVADLDVRSDLYSLGVTMYVALTCRQPFLADDVVGTIANVLKTEAPDPRAFNPAISQAMSTLVVKAMRKDRKRRHQSAAEFLDHLLSIEDESRNEISASGVNWFGKLFGSKPGKG